MEWRLAYLAKRLVETGWERIDVEVRERQVVGGVVGEMKAREEAMEMEATCVDSAQEE